MQIYKRLLKYLKPYWPRLVIAGICMLGLAGMTAILAYLVKPALDGIFIEKNDRMLLMIPLFVAAVYIFKGVCDFGQYYLMSFVGQSVIRDLRNQMFVKLEEMSVEFFCPSFNWGIVVSDEQ